MQTKVLQLDTDAGQFINSVFLMINGVRNEYGSVTHPPPSEYFTHSSIAETFIPE
jgi:hypothetical protein